MLELDRRFAGRLQIHAQRLLAESLPVDFEINAAADRRLAPGVLNLRFDSHRKVGNGQLARQAEFIDAEVGPLTRLPVADVDDPHAGANAGLAQQIVETRPQIRIAGRPAAALPVGQHDDVTRQVAGSAEDVDGPGDAGGEIRRAGRRRQFRKAEAHPVEVLCRRLDDRPDPIPRVQQRRRIARAHLFQEIMDPLDGRRVRRDRFAFPPHAVGAVDHEHDVTAAGRDQIRQETARNPRPRQGHDKQRDQPDPHQQQQQFFKLQFPPRVSTQLEELHRAPLDDVVLLLAEQMCENRQRDAGQADQHQRVDKIERHRLLSRIDSTPSNRAVGSAASRLVISRRPRTM